MDALSHILDKKIIAIVRGAEPGAVLQMAESLCEGGIQLMEITLNSPQALAVIEELTKKMGDKMLIGAGTVLTVQDAEKAIASGARFIISPIVDVATIEVTRRHGVVSIPGAYTPTEIVHARTSGGHIIKVFPASSNMNYIKEIRGPLPHIPLMPTGGINLDNIREFKDAGAVAFGIGTALVNTKENPTKQYMQQITEKARAFVQAVSTVES